MNNNDVEDQSLSSAEKGISVCKKGLKKSSSFLKALLAPFLPYLILIVIGLLVIFLIMLVIFWAAPQGQLYTGTGHTKEDERLLTYYKKLADENNKKDRWLVPGESDINDTWYSKLTSDHRGVNAENYYEVLKSGRELLDRYGRDIPLLETFGQIQAGDQFYVITFHKDKTDDAFKAKIASDFRPYIYYKDSTVTTRSTGSNGNTQTSVTHVFLMVESNTLQGHVLYNYEWCTESGDGYSITYERPAGTTEILPNPWQRLDDWVKENYQLDNEDDVEMLRSSVWEGAIGYTDFKENLEWLFSGKVSQFYLSEGFIPVELQEYFKKVSQIFGIPEWFLEAIAYKESSFNPLAENASGAFGLFQLMPSTQKVVVDELVRNFTQDIPSALIEKYNNTPDKDAAFYKQIVSDPYINVLGGALELMEKGLKPEAIDWNSENWKEQTLPFLASYGGFARVPEKLWSKYGISSASEARNRDKVLAWAKDDYASAIWNFADKFKLQGIWPTKQAPITAYFGQSGSHWQSVHTGIDIGVPNGTPVYAVVNGNVVFAGWNSAYGNLIKISNGWYMFYYGHLSQINVSKGDKVTVGQTIGLSGHTGNVTGPHLHFEIRNANGAAIDPLTWLPPR